MGAKLLGIVIENISNNVLKKTPLFASSDVNTAPLLLPLSILVKLNNHHVLVKFTKRTKGREGGGRTGNTFPSSPLYSLSHRRICRACWVLS